MMNAETEVKVYTFMFEMTYCGDFTSFIGTLTPHSLFSVKNSGSF